MSTPDDTLHHTDPHWSQPAIVELQAGEPTSNIYRRICHLAGTPVRAADPDDPSTHTGPGRVIVPQGYGSPYRMATLLRRVLGDENATVFAFEKTDEHGTQTQTTWAAFSARRASYAIRTNQPQPTDSEP